MPGTNNHILVTGCPRSGTTFLGKVLALPGEICYVSEPFNKDFGLEGLDKQFVHMYRGMNNEDYYRRILKSLLTGHARFKRLPVEPNLGLRQNVGRLLFKSGTNLNYRKARLTGSRRLLLKDPMACLAARYMQQQFDVEVVVIVRHPIPNLASMRRVGVDHTLVDLVEQPRLYHKYLKPILGGVNVRRLPELERRCLVWSSLNYMLHEFARTNPRFKVVRHNELCSEPESNFRKLYDQLGLDYTPEIEAKIRELTSAKNPVNVENGAMHVLGRDSRGMSTGRYKTFSPEEEKVIHSLTDDVTKLFFPVTDWPLPHGATQLQEERELAPA